MKYDSSRIPGYDPRFRKYTPEQYRDFITLGCKIDGLEFLGFEPMWQGTNKTKVAFRCPEHGYASVNASRFINQGARCKKCAAGKQSKLMTKGADHWKRLLIERCGYSEAIMVKMVSGEPWVFCNICSEDDFSSIGGFSAWFRAPKGTIHYGGKSCRCSPRWRMSEEERRFAVSFRCDLLGYSLSKKHFGGIGYREKVSITCPEHGEFESDCNNFLASETACPQCAKFGYQKSRPGYLYLLYSDCGSYMKIGITNNVSRRVKSLKSCTPFGFSLAAYRVFECGSEAMQKESELHRKFNSAGLRGFSGCTEWLFLDGRAVEHF